MNKEYIIRNKLYNDEDLGRIILNFDNDSCVIYPLEDYSGLHPSYFLLKWSEEGKKVVGGSDSEMFIRRRVCPPGRHNIKGVLKSHNLEEYNACTIIDYNNGECDSDNLWFEEVSS